MDGREKQALNGRQEAQPAPDPGAKPTADVPAKPQPWRYNLYARIPLKLRTVDIFICVMVALLILVLVYGVLTRGS